MTMIENPKNEHKRRLAEMLGLILVLSLSLVACMGGEDAPAARHGRPGGRRPGGPEAAQGGPGGKPPLPTAAVAVELVERGDIATYYSATASLDPNKEADKLAAEKIELTRKAMKADYDAKEQAWTAREATLVGSASSAMIETAIDVALADKEVAGIAKIMKPIIRPSVRVSEEAGRFSLWVQDPDHPDQPMLNGSGDPMTVKELALELKKDPELAGGYQASKPKGGGATPSHIATNRQTSQSEGLTGAARIAQAIRDQGLG